MKLKKLLSILIACALLLALAAGCNGDDPAPVPSPSGDDPVITDGNDNEEPTGEPVSEPADEPVGEPAAPAGEIEIKIPDSGLYVLDPLNTNIFSAVEGDGFLDYNFKDSGGAWVNIMNPWGDSVFLVFEPGEGFVQSYIITFKVEGYDGGDEGYRTMCGFAINGFSPSLWSLDEGMDDGMNWEEVFGEKYNYIIDGDGVYQIIVSLRAAMDFFEEHNDWYIKDYLEAVDCIELGIYGVPEDTNMIVTILGIEESGDIFSFENIQRPLGSGAFFAASIDELPALPSAEPAREPRIGAEDEE
ncbi:MAG: hypothetical protein LBC86_06525 [Oscillospiraceae bacterium]|jgi:hypothetical protein|nr:hypothetical protein [Oscillospiraceae bacterium]